MAETSLTLYVDLKPGTRIELEVAANAALAWSRFIKNIGAQIDPFHEWHVELDSSLPGSQKIRSIIRLADTPENRAAIVAAITTAIFFTFKEAAAWGIGHVMDLLTGPDAPQEVTTLSEKDRLQIAEEVLRRIQQGPAPTSAQPVFDALEKDDNVRGVGVTSSATERPRTVIGRDQFPSQRTEETESEPAHRTTVEALELTLIRPVLTADPKRRWQFVSLYGTFGAPIHDQQFLADLAEGRLNIPMAQGIRMLVEIEVTEERQGDIWKPIDRVVTKVIRIIPPDRRSLFDSDDAE